MYLLVVHREGPVRTSRNELVKFAVNTLVWTVNETTGRGSRGIREIPAFSLISSTFASSSSVWPISSRLFVQLNAQEINPPKPLVVGNRIYWCDSPEITCPEGNWLQECVAVASREACFQILP